MYAMQRSTRSGASSAAWEVEATPATRANVRSAYSARLSEWDRRGVGRQDASAREPRRLQWGGEAEKN
jgi:hypothetical protein